MKIKVLAVLKSRTLYFQYILILYLYLRKIEIRFYFFTFIIWRKIKINQIINYNLIFIETFIKSFIYIINKKQSFIDLISNQILKMVFFLTFLLNC